jgi:hypothetical protein
LSGELKFDRENVWLIVCYGEEKRKLGIVEKGKGLATYIEALIQRK